MPRRDTDRNLLFGILALQMDFVTRDDLVAAMNAWLLEKHRAIGEILVQRNALDPLARDALDRMVDLHIAKHGGDPLASLAALSSAGGIANDLRRSIAADPDLQASLDSVRSSQPEQDPYATRSTAPPEPPPSNSRFRKVREHSAGNLGVVYVARDEELNRDVALKEIKAKNADRLDSQAKFLLEAEVTGGLEHPGIVPVYGLGHYDDGRPFYAMRFIRGKSLLDAIKRFHADDTLKADPGRRLLELQKLLRRFTDVCNAIAYAHSRGVLHRDLKPDNVMVGKYGETLVVDWGLAKALGTSGSATIEDPEDPEDPLPETSLQPRSADGPYETNEGERKGTPVYMSPEQAAGRLDLLGPSSDIYGLGATLYHLIVGQTPIKFETIHDLFAKIQAGEIIRPRAVVPWLDPALEAICLKAMALKPSDRYATPKALAEDLDRWIAGEPVTAYREPWTRRTRRWTRKNRTAVATVGSAATVAALLTAAYAWSIVDRTRKADATGLDTLAKAEYLVPDARKTDDPIRLSEAIAEARRAEGQLETGGGSAPALSLAKTKLAELQTTLDVIKRDQKMLADLTEARLSGANVKDGHFDAEAMAKAILAAFRSYEIDLANLTSEEAATRVRSSRIATDLVAALDEAIPYVTASLSKGLAAVARLADPVGSEIRERIDRRDFEGLRRLVADEAGLLRWGARCRTIFTTLARLDPTVSLPLLEAIHGRDRTDFWLTHDLARACFEAKPPRLEQAIRHSYASRALKPTSPGVLNELGFLLDIKGESDAAIAAYREAIRLKPDYAEAHTNLGAALHDKGEWDAAIAACREAIRLKPDYAMAHTNLGGTLHDKGEWDAAIAAYREAVRLKPDYAEAHYNLGVTLDSKGEWDAAIAAYREAVRLKPDFAQAYDNLGVDLKDKGEWDAAIAAHREAIRLRPDYAATHSNLGNALLGKGERDAAIAAHREAIRLKPDHAETHLNLGNVLASKGEWDAAIAACRDAIRLKPDLAQAQCLLGLILESQGRFSEALAHYERGHELGSRTKGWAYPSAQWVQSCRRLVEMEAKLPAVLKGEGHLVEPGERLEMAALCSRKALHVASARFYGQAFANQPTLAEDLDAANRYNAACAAALAGSRTGKDDPPPDDSMRIKLREQARSWLRADLAAWEKLLDGGNARNRPSIVQNLAHWKTDADLAGIRDEAALAKLSGGEREGFRTLWAEVDKLLAKARAGSP